MSKPERGICDMWFIDTLDLLIMDKEVSGDNDVYVMVKGRCQCDVNGVLDTEGKIYYYNEHTCPWNYLRFPIMINNNQDPHGVFQWVSSIILPDDYDGDGDFVKYFPSVFGGCSHEKNS